SGGALVVHPWLRFHIPLIEPDVQISRIRLSDKTSRLCSRVQRLLQFLNTRGVDRLPNLQVRPALLVTQCQQRSFGFSEPHEREGGATRCGPGFRAAGPKAPNPARRFPHPQPDRPFLVRSPTPQLSRPPREKG